MIRLESYETSLRLEEMVPNVLVEIIKGGSHCFNDGTSGEVIEKTINFFRELIVFYSTVTDLAKFLGLSISQPLRFGCFISY